MGLEAAKRFKQLSMVSLNSIDALKHSPSQVTVSKITGQQDLISSSSENEGEKVKEGVIKGLLKRVGAFISRRTENEDKIKKKIKE